MKTFKLLSFLFVSMLALVSCGGGANADDVAKKLQDGTDLDKQDYTVMIEYVSEVVDKVAPIMEEAAKDPEAAKEKAEKLEAEYPHTEAFMQAIMTAPADKVDQKQQEQFMGKIMSMAMGMQQLGE